MVQTSIDIETKIKEIFAKQQQNAPKIALTTAKERIAKIKSIMDWMIQNESKIADALYKDYKKHPAEVKISEMMPVIGEGKYVIKHLKNWMSPQDVPTPLKMIGTTSRIIHEPKGNCLIISPWNYPINLTFKPLIQAIAAGNVVMIKPSEMVTHTSALLSSAIRELFDENEIAVIEGDAEVSQQILELPFNHIFFTGSPAVGKIVMAAAAKNLASITLELGGKSPTIIDETANVKDAAQKLAAEKFLNNGQTCIAPDYVLVHHSKKRELIDEMNKYLAKLYGNDVESNGDYCRIVNQRHFSRVNGLIDDAVAKGAKVEIGGQVNPNDNFVSPTVLSNVSDNMKILQQEIFGPVLPIIEFADNQEVVDYIRKNEKPLALYIFSSKRKNIDYFLANTSAGGTVINETSIHYLQDNLPFGGVNNSGIGKSFGKYGFDEFSNIRAVVEHKFSSFKMFHPPYTNRVMKMLDMVIKYL
ncbi:MAG: aldehyde dehydrogenase family protein [Spirosomataceae bacterium]